LENVLLFYAMPYVWVNHWIGKKPCSCTCRWDLSDFECQWP
jgi:hypothetical protein